MLGRTLGALGIAVTIVGLAWSTQRASPSKERLIASIQGPALYKAYCAVCHGPQAKGDGPMAATLKVRPADLTRISARHGGAFPLMQIEQIISGEEELRGHGPMPAWGPVFSQVDRDQDLGRVRIDNLARYLRDLQSDAAEGRVTFQRDVLPILAKQCQYCHRPGQVAPMSFLTYETTRPWAAQIKAMVTAKKMPPAVGSSHYTVLTRGEGLTQAEITTLVRWVDEGVPEGTARDPKPTPPPSEK